MTEKFDVSTVVYRLVGDITPLGETNTDNARFESLKELAELVQDLVWDLREVSRYADRPEYSMKRAGEYAKNALELIAGEMHDFR